MRYSRNLAIALMGASHFDKSLILSLRSQYRLSVPEDLDVMETLLFFFLLETSRLTPSKFLNFFFRIDKVKYLEGRRIHYLNAFEEALRKIQLIKIQDVPCIFNLTSGRFYTYKISTQLERFKKTFHSEIQGSDFWIENRKLGINIAYTGAFIYFQGLFGKEEIDLKKLDNIPLLQHFKQIYSPQGEWRNYSIIRSLVKKFVAKKIFKQDKILRNDFHDYVLKIESINKAVPSLQYHEQKEDLLVHKIKKISWKGGVPHEEGFLTHDFSNDRKILQRPLNVLNKMNLDIRYKGEMLPNQTHLEYNDSRLSRLLKFDCPVSRIRRKNWINVTFGEKACSVIEIEHLQTLYLNSCLKRKKEENPYTNVLLEKTKSSLHPMLYDIALDSMLYYGDTPKRARQSFRQRYHKYTKQGVTKREINSFFYFLNERVFQIKKRFKRIISKEKYFYKGFQTFLGTVMKLSIPIPMIVTNNALIVPEGSEIDVLFALSESYRSVFGDKRLATFKVTSKNSKKRYRFSNHNKLKEIAS